MKRGLFLIACALLPSCARGLPLAQRVRGRASHDLHCPIADVDAYETGVGGWVARGCGQRIAYVCSRGTCTRDGDIDESAPPLAAGDDTAWDVGPWICTVHGASTEDARTSMRSLGQRVEQLASCGLRSLRANVDGASGRVSVVEWIASDQRCVIAAFEGATIGGLATDHTFECDRP